MPRWMCGLTTVPARRRDLLPRTLASLEAGGFPKGMIHLFIDGGDDGRSWREEFGMEVTCRAPAVRTAGAWICALWELYAREPGADLFAILQDDFTTCRNLRPYLEKTCRIERAYYSIYLFPSNESVRPPGHVGWYEAREVGEGAFYHGKKQQSGRGAVGLIFPRAAVMDLLSARHMVEARHDPHRGWRKIDGSVVESMNQAGWREHVHWPSLSQHEGNVSTCNSMPHKRALSYPGEAFDLMTLLEKQPRG